MLYSESFKYRGKLTVNITAAANNITKLKKKFERNVHKSIFKK